MATTTRRWITREEIAEIHDELAKRAIDDPRPTVNKAWSKAKNHLAAADDIRATERLSQPRGNRVA